MNILNYSLTALALAGAALSATPAMADTTLSQPAPVTYVGMSDYNLPGPVSGTTSSSSDVGCNCHQGTAPIQNEGQEPSVENDHVENSGFFAPDMHVLVSSNDTVVTGEYAWQKGRLSGFGFIDISTATDFYITDHEVRVEVADPVFVSAEGGYNRYGGAMGKIGIGVNLTGLPVVRDTFAYLRVYAQKSVFGPDADHLVGMSWGTKDIRLGRSTSLYFSGFADIKANAPDVIQPQAWLRFDGLPIEVGSEVSFFGRERTVSAAVKLSF